MLAEIDNAFFQSLQIFFAQLRSGNAAVVFECLHSCDKNSRVRVKSRQPALDIHEFLGAQIRAEAGFRNDIIRKSERCLRRADRIAAMRDVCKRPAVHKCRRMFQRLQKVRLHRVF